MTTQLDGPDDALPAVQPGQRPAARATRPNPTGHRTSLPVGARSGRGTPGSTSSAASSTSSARRRDRRRAAQRPSSVIFPRYHQWDAVLRARGRRPRATAPGQLVPRPALGRLGQDATRSPGSRTASSSLHGADDQQGLRQGRRHHRPGDPRPPAAGDDLPVRARDAASSRGSTRTRRSSPTALAGEQARIIITTLQKFPFVLDKVGDLGQPPLRGHRRRGALVADRRGRQGPARPRSARRPPRQQLDGGRGRRGGGLLAGRRPARTRSPRPWRPADASRTSRSSPSPRRRRPGRSSCSARKNPDGNYAPFHLYSMRQAIEEGFILDVLANYTTYETYWKVEQGRSRTTPSTTPRKARRAIARFVSLHPHNLAQKAEIIVEHFREHTRHKIGGAGQGDGRHLVAPARRPLQAGHRQVHRRARATPTSKALVAFSGQGRRRRRLDVHRVGHERLPREPDGRASSTSRDYGVLIVAEKFQTGFDQPLLHTMYVDKTLVGLAAVQTLSRLNRIHPREDRHVRPRLPQRGRGHRRGVRAVLRRDRRAADRPEPPLGHPAPARRLRRAASRGDRGGDARAARRRRVRREALGRGLRRARPGQGSLRGSWATRSAWSSATRSTASCAPTRSSPRSSPSPTRRWSATTSTAGRSSLYLRDTGTVERLDLGTEVELTHLRHQMTFSGTLVADVGDRRGAILLRARARAAAGARHRAPLQHRRGPQRAVRDRPDRRRPAAARPVRGELGRRRRALRPGPEQHASTTSASSSTASSSRRSSRAWTPTTRSSRRSSTTRTSARRSATSTCARSTSGCERAHDLGRR